MTFRHRCIPDAKRPHTEKRHAIRIDSRRSRPVPQLFAGLGRIGKDAPIPYLAELWEIDSQAKRFRFHLRNGATFHDGIPITANDMAFSIRAAQRHHPCFRTGFAPGPLQRALRFTD
ncbi:ABC transporter substrate-binding protein [uncultured Bilophila sp.]|uniref:ABC transporter substrate-binding protein n=1 Tax=uncultured Bilophila sp. TaxID=529385 RepID=UPI00280BEBCA|nr:ABC transporter substrate-binding protein [uncultured Bilophila sp.]